jgi:hypothetical protein
MGVRATMRRLRSPALNSSVTSIQIKPQADPILGCPVCLYWSERLETRRTYALSASEAIAENERLLTILREHQVKGACIRRLPYLMELLTEPEDTQLN